MNSKSAPIENTSICIEVEIDSCDLTTAIKERLNSASQDGNHEESDPKITVVSIEQGMGFGETMVIDLIVAFSSGVASGIVANSIYDLLACKVRRLLVERRRVRPNREDLERAIQTIVEFTNAQEDEVD